MYFPTTRVLTVLELLQSHHRISGPELAARLEVDIRTVRRYITMLQDLGIPVEAGRGRYGYYQLRPGFKLPPLMFTDEEAFALTIGLIAARKLGLAVAAPAVEGVLAKVKRILPVMLQEQVQAVQQTLGFDYPSVVTTPMSKLVITLGLASSQRRRVRLCYCSWNGEETDRPFDPYGLVCRSGYWYTVGYCHLRADLRTFRLDRVRQVEIGDEPFERPADFNCLEHVERSIAMTPARWLVEVLLQTTLEEASRRISPALAVLEQTANGVIMRCNVDDLDWIAYVLAGLDCPLEIRSPGELHEALRRLAERVAGLAACRESEKQGL